MNLCLEKPVNEKLKETAYYILNKCASGNFFGKTVLFKLLYFSDFNFPGSGAKRGTNYSKS